MADNNNNPSNIAPHPGSGQANNTPEVKQQKRKERRGVTGCIMTYLDSLFASVQRSS